MEQLTFDILAATPELSDTSNLDALLELVLWQARAIGIPVSDAIAPHVVINRRAKTRFGCCKEQNGRFIIELAACLIGGPPESCLLVLTHEALHTCPGCRNHGARWKQYAALMRRHYGYEIARTDSFARLGLAGNDAPRYLLVCQQCGCEFPRMRASKLTKYPSRYRCRCGGRLQRCDPASRQVATPDD